MYRSVYWILVSDSKILGTNQWHLEMDILTHFNACVQLIAMKLESYSRNNISTYYCNDIRKQCDKNKTKRILIGNVKYMNTGFCFLLLTNFVVGKFHTFHTFWLLSSPPSFISFWLMPTSPYKFFYCIYYFRFCFVTHLI